VSEAADFEALLRRTLTPVEPPGHLVERLEDALTEIAEAAAGELESLELSSMRDPRNWLRPAAAAVAGTAAGTALVILGARHSQRRRATRAGNALERALRGAADEARKLLERDGDARS